VKPGSDLAAIMNTVNRETNTLTKQDAVVVWGGIRDISRNESQKGVCQLRNFVEKYYKTNVLVVYVPKRFDLEAHSCINYEVNAFNKKLGKHMKSFHHASTVEVTSNRELFTKHGLHLNRKGKEQAAKPIASAIKEIFKLQEKDPIKMS
jgi:lysophospholipase L1-like esterase